MGGEKGRVCWESVPKVDNARRVGQKERKTPKEEKEKTWKHGKEGSRIQHPWEFEALCVLCCTEEVYGLFSFGQVEVSRRILSC